MCRHIYDWNIVNCDVKQPIQLNSTKPVHVTYTMLGYVSLTHLVQRITKERFAQEASNLVGRYSPLWLDDPH